MSIAGFLNHLKEDISPNPETVIEAWREDM